MSGKVQIRLAVLAALAALVAVLVPSGLALGEHGDASDDPSFVNDGLIVQDKGNLLLAMGSNDYFHWDEDGDGIVDSMEKYEGIKLQKKNTCTSVVSSSIPGSFGGTFADLVGDANTPNVGAYAGSATPPYNDSTEIATGLIKDYFGASGPGETANGDPCGQANHPGEALAVKISQSGPLAGFSMLRVDLDLEFKFSGTARFEFLDETGNRVTYTHYRTKEGGTTTSGPNQDLFMGMATFDPMAATGDDGPDSADGDNYRVYLEPLVDVSGPGEDPIFDHVPFSEIVIIPTAGALSLGGGDDLAATADNRGQIADTFFSEFDLAKTFDGQFTCGETVNISDVVVPEIFGDVTLHSMDIDTTMDGSDEDGILDDDFVTSGCLLKFYDDLVQALDNDEDAESINEVSQLAFVPQLTTTLGRYTIEITVKDQLVTTDPDTGQITSLAVLYNATGDLTFPTTGAGLQQCKTQPPNTDPEDKTTDDGDGVYDPSAWTGDLGLLPSGETACYYSVAATTERTLGGKTYGTEIWKIFFLADPSMRF